MQDIVNTKHTNGWLNVCTSILVLKPATDIGITQYRS